MSRLTHCHLCRTELEPVSVSHTLAAMRTAGWDKPGAEREQAFAYAEALEREPEWYENALHISFDGGYGEFFDVVPPLEAPRVILCGSCAHALAEREPWIASLLRLDRGIHYTGCPLERADRPAAADD